MWAAGDDLTERRLRMVERDIARRGVSDAGVLDAMRAVPRERFLPANLAEFAYQDTPLPIEEARRSRSPSSWRRWPRRHSSRAKAACWR